MPASRQRGRPPGAPRHPTISEVFGTDPLPATRAAVAFALIVVVGERTDLAQRVAGANDLAGLLAVWPDIADQLSRPWSREAAEVDLLWLAGRAGPQFGRERLAVRWGWSPAVVRALLAQARVQPVPRTRES